MTSLTENSTNIFFKLISNKGNSFILFCLIVLSSSFKKYVTFATPLGGTGNSINKFSTIFSRGTSGNFSLKTSAKVLILLYEIETFLSFKPFIF